MANTATGVFGNDPDGKPATNTAPWYALSLILGALQSGVPITGSSTDSNLPYGADEQVLTNVVGGPGPTVIVYKKAGVTVKTRTLTYTGATSADVLTHTVDS